MAEREGKTRCPFEELLVKKLILPAALLSLIFLNACSSETAVSPNNNASFNSNGPSIVRIPAENTNQTTSNNQINPALKKPGNRRVTETEPNGQPPPVSNVQGVPAPFDSTIKTLMNRQNQFVEMREFKNDALLQKIERLQEIKKITVYLKNGKVINLAYEKGDKLFLAASPDDILIAAGAKSAPTPAPANPNAKKP